MALVLALLFVIGGAASALAADSGGIGPGRHIVNSGRHLTPYGKIVQVGNFPTGGATTPDGRFYWTVSAGAGFNDVRIVAVETAKVVQTIALPGASGGVTIDPRGGAAYVSGIANSTNRVTSRPKLPGGKGDVLHVFKYSKTTGKATETGRIAVPPPPGAPMVEDFPLHRAPIAYPEHLAISNNGKTLLVPLGLSDAAAIVDTATRSVRYVGTGHYPYGAAILRGARFGLVTNEATGTASQIDLVKGTKVKDIVVGGHLAHPEAIVATDRFSYVTITNRDQVGVIDNSSMKLVRVLSVEGRAGVGASPNALAVTREGRQLLVASAGADLLSVFSIPQGTSHDITHGFGLLGRIPTAHYPTDVQTTATRVLWLSGKGFGIGPNPKGPDPYHSAALDQDRKLSQFAPRITFGSVGIGALPNKGDLERLTELADAQVIPANHVPAPENTPLRAGGPIKHVFFIVRENRTYDQILGDDPRGEGKASLTLFGKANTPNLHALVNRFPLLDHLYANSEASQQGHQWTAAGSISDYSEKNWNQVSNVFGSYGARGRPLQFGLYAVSYPTKGYLFDQALRQKISFFKLAQGAPRWRRPRRWLCKGGG